MKSEEKALPWFPITPEYIDTYHDSVLKYIRDARTDSSQDMSNDSSYLTTVNLLFQRAEQIALDVCGKELREMEQITKKELEKDAKILAAAAFLSVGDREEKRRRYMAVLVYLLSLLKSDISDVLVPLYIKCISAEKIENVGVTLDDIVDFDVISFVRALSGMKVTEAVSEKWYENHGTVKIDKDGVSIYEFNRFFLGVKSKNGTSFKPILSAEDGGVQVLQDKKDKRPFSIISFLNTVADTVPEVPEEEKKKRYIDGDILTVKVLNKGYDTIYAESTDPAYETIAGQVVIITASNVRGLYLSDICRNITLDSYLNVKYHQSENCFSIDDTILDFIRKTYWEEDEENQQYMKMNAILLFPYHDLVKNTWLTEYGFLVRTEYEQLERYSYRTLEITEYDDDLDFFMARVSDDVPTGKPISQNEAKDNFLRLLFYKSPRIASAKAPRKEIKMLEKELVSLLHRILAIKQNSALPGSDNKSIYICVSSALAAVAEDIQDLEYYQFTWGYLQALIAFARRRYDEIKALDKGGSDDYGVLHKSTMVDVLREYDKPEESEVLTNVISMLGDTDLSDVAKLVQASNRFIGSQSLERLRDDLHREICTILNITDAIVSTPDSDSEKKFPFPPEDDRIEHKMSWVYDNASGLPNESEQSNKILKTVCAFMNRFVEQGESHLFIGTDEKRRYINGIKADVDFLISKGALTAQGDTEDEYCRHIMSVIKKRFPDSFQYVSPHLKENDQVLDLCVTPAVQGIVYLDGIPYYRYGSESRKMPDNIKQEILDRKYLMHDNMTDKIDDVNKGIQTSRCVILKGYDSSNSNTTGTDRTVEAFSFVDNGRFDAIWAYDFSGKEKKNKVFLLKRASGIEVSPRNWQYAKQHKKYDLDMFGFYGEEKIDFNIELKTTRAKNTLVEQFPDVKGYLETLPDGRWQVHGTLLNKLSLAAACGFYLGLADDIDISKSPVFKEYVNERLSYLIEKL